MKLSFLTNCSSKKLSLYLLIFLTLCVILQIWIIHHITDVMSSFTSILSLTRGNIIIRKPHNATKYVLSWHRNGLIFQHHDSIFPSLNCSIKDCQFTENRFLLEGDYTNFDAIIFTDDELTTKFKPDKRNRSQLYIFNTIESSYNKPACELYNDNFFNWTFTYRLDSTVPWTYFVVRNSSGSIIAPSIDVAWKETTKPVKPRIRSLLSKKKKAAAWLVSHCTVDSCREDYLTKLQEHLFHFSLNIDVYGGCTRKPCDNGDCEKMIKNDYFFYMAFENSLAEDYVTEKVLHGYQNYAVPVVYGGANYSRFLPPGSYINAREIHPYHLAHIINEVVMNPSRVETFFKWTNLYSVDANVAGDHPLCSLCAALHGAKTNAPAPDKFRLWWNGVNGMKWCLSDAYWNETAEVNIDTKHIINLY